MTYVIINLSLSP